MTFERYAIRRLNPFGGVAHVVTGDGARAITVDGARWEIQVLAEAPNDLWGSLNRHAHQTRFFRFGIWSRETGLRRVPINPIMDVGAMLEAARPLLAEIEAAADSLPFPLADALELWLLDRDGQPLALLMSATPGEDLSGFRERRWCAAPMSDRNLGRPRPPDERPVADDLESLVRRASGPGQTCWIRREAAGSGAGLVLAANEDGATLDAHVFPELPVRARLSLPREDALVERWVEWSAPRLLCLPYVGNPMRRRLEGHARKNAREVNTLWRLYPREVDPEFIRRARVEARLRRAAETV